VDVRPFTLGMTRMLVQGAVKRGALPPDTVNLAPWLHRRADGCPSVLCSLLEELAAGGYDIGSRNSLERLDLDRRIHEIFRR
jgi:hypothetical protein